jgi:putative hemolysin
LIDNVIWQGIGLILLILISAFFSASETALMALSKIKIRHMLDEKTKGAELIYKLVSEPGKLLSTILLGNNLVNIGASAIATSLALTYFDSAGVLLSTIGMTVIILIFAEITPKSIAAHNPDKIARIVSKILYPLAIVLGPIVKVLTDLTNWLIGFWGGKTENVGPSITQEEFRTIVSLGFEEGILEKQEQEIINNIFEFKNAQAGSVMIPRTHMVALDIHSTYDEIMELFKENTFSKVPVYEESKDNIIGILYLKDIVFWNGKIELFELKNFIKQPFFSYEFTSIGKVFSLMKAKKVSIAIILGEYGGTAGIITIGDLVKEIIGDIEDEFDEKDKQILEVNDQEFIVDGSTKLEKLNDIIKINIEAEDFDSISGFIMWKLKRLPEVQDTIEDEKLTMVVEEVEKNRIKKIRIFIHGTEKD